MKKLLTPVVTAAAVAASLSLPAASLASNGGGTSEFCFYQPLPSGNFLVEELNYGQFKKDGGTFGPSRVYTTDRPPASCDLGGF